MVLTITPAFIQFLQIRKYLYGACDYLSTCNYSDIQRTELNRVRKLRKYPWERYEPPYPPSYGLKSTASVLLGEWSWL